MASHPRLEYIADIHSRVHFCRGAALFRLRGGEGRIVCRDWFPGVKKPASPFVGGENKSSNYDLYLNGVPLVKTHIPDSELRAEVGLGYGDGLSKEPGCLAVRGRLNAGYEGLKHSSDVLAPFVGLLSSGLYAVADFDLFQVRPSDKDHSYFWDEPAEDSYESELQLERVYWYIGVVERHDAPRYIIPSRRAADFDPAAFEAYRSRISEGDRFPRAVALYLNGAVTLMLDGHHKAAACAAEGVPVRTLVIFHLDDDKAPEEAYLSGKRLYMHHGIGYERYPGPLTIRDGQDNELCRVCGVDKIKLSPVTPADSEKTDWGRVSDEFRTEKFRNFPSDAESGTHIPPDRIRSLMEEERSIIPGTRHWRERHITELRAYAKRFPDSKLLSVTDRAWLSRPDSEF
ncbi:MAG: hypothetical protein IJE08_16255 [Clostridia bacterium]|nr:hypothetical protein [Clostridia bacterium]